MSRDVIEPIPTDPSKNRGSVAIVGGGWNGSHIALSLARKGYSVTIFERLPAIFAGVSGAFGIRIHAGPHYPRSPATRNSCRSGFYEFLDEYSGLVNEHEYSIYALGKKDADGNDSKITEQAFRDVCEEFKFKQELSIKESGYNSESISAAFDLKEPSAILGSRLRTYFEDRLNKAGVTVKCDFSVTDIQKTEEGIVVYSDAGSQVFDSVVNATSFQALLPKKMPLPHNMQVVYQVCLALEYEDTQPKEKPISFIVLDGWFPCLMPYDDREVVSEPLKKYIMTHGKWTIAASFPSPEEAYSYLQNELTDSVVEREVKDKAQEHMDLFWPRFSGRFRYLGWKGAVLAKIKNNREFRGGVVFQDSETDVICAFPGKITNIFDSARETACLLAGGMGQNILTTSSGYRYVEGGVFDQASREIAEQIDPHIKNTCELQSLVVQGDETSAHQERGFFSSDFFRAAAFALLSVGVAVAVAAFFYRGEEASVGQENPFLLLSGGLFFLFVASFERVIPEPLANFSRFSLFGVSEDLNKGATPFVVGDASFSLCSVTAAPVASFD